MENPLVPRQQRCSNDGTRAMGGSTWCTVKARRRKEIERRGERKEVLFVMTVDSVSSPALPGVAWRLKVSVVRSGDGQVLNGNQIAFVVSRREEGRRR